MTREGDTASMLADLRTSVEVSHKALGLIGESDWTPQDSVHLHLLTMVEKFLAALTVEVPDAQA